MEVKIISSETIKPSSATPSHLQKLTLSLLDQKTFPVTVPILVFYSAPEGPARLDTTRLKTCLSEALASFYPLAGRFQRSSILCNDQGIPFFEAQVNCPLSTVLGSLSSSSSIDLRSFYPPRDDLVASGINVAIQVNVFTCGGFAIGCYHTHKITDGTSAGNFFRHWAALVAKRYEDAALARPDFNSGVAAFPPVVEEPPPVNDKKQENKGSLTSLFETRAIVRSFLIKNKAVAELKAKSASDQVPNPSRFEAVAGFLWKSLSSTSLEEGRTHTLLNITVDLRSRSDPPLPTGSMGNLFEFAMVRAERRVQLHELVAEIRGSIAKMKDLALEYKGEKREEAKDENWKKFLKVAIECIQGKDAYVITPWCKYAGFSEVDFGFGGPKRVVPVDNLINLSVQRNMIMLTEYRDLEGDGFEAWMFMDEETFHALESNPEFLSFASPNF